MHIAFSDLCQTAPKHYIVPFSALRHLSAVLQGISTFSSSKYHVCNHYITVKMTHIGLLAHITY